jgi:hypothetical protein
VPFSYYKKRVKLAKKMTVGFNSAFTAESVAYLPKFQSQYGDKGWEELDAVKHQWGPRYDGTNQQVGPTFLRGYGLATQVIPYSQ